MTTYPPPANWYPDPDQLGGLRYWDGNAWTAHRTPYPAQIPPYYGPPGRWGKPPWKGADLGLPPTGPGSLAEPARRLGARMLDILLLVPVFGVLLTVTLLIAAPHFGPWFPPTDTGVGTTTNPPLPGFFWLYVVVLGCLAATSLVMLAYQTIAVGAYGRTLGMAWLGLRPVRLDGTPLGWGRAFSRALIFWVAGFLGWLGLLDPLWCLWDERRQCLHDMVAGSIVINDRGDDTGG